MHTFEETQDNDIYVCGIQPFDADYLMHGMIVTRDRLECHHPVDFEYYSSPKIATALTSKLCAYCGGSSRAWCVASVAPHASHEEVLAPVAAGSAVASFALGVDVPTFARPRGRNRKHLDEPLATRSRKARSRRE